MPTLLWSYSCNKALLQIIETKIFEQKRFIKDLINVGINQIMSKLLTLSKRFQLNCQQITAVACNVTLHADKM